MEDNHEDERGRKRLSEQAASLQEELLVSGVLEWLEEPDEYGRTLQLAPALQQDFALNQPLASFAQAAFDLIDPESENFSLDVLSVVESILDDPFPVLYAQTRKAKDAAVASMKADGIEYEERMALLEEITYPKPLEEPLRQALSLYRETHPWVLDSDLSPKSVVRDMYEWGRTFTEFIAYYGIARAEGLVLRYLTDTYRALRQTVPDRVKTDELDDIEEWLGETVRQIDSSLLDEWEALTDPESVARAAAAAAAGEPIAPPRPITANERAFRVMVRNAMFQRVQLAARDRYFDLAALESELPGKAVMPAHAWEEALGAYWDEYEALGDGPAARSPELLMIEATAPRTWTARQIIDDPEGNHDWAIVATVDLDASDAAGEPVIRTQSFSAGMTRPPGGMPPPRTAELDGVTIELTPLAEAVAERYFAEFPEDLERYGDAAMPWEIHDTLHTLNWAVLDVRGFTSLEKNMLWLAQVLSRATSRSSTSRATSRSAPTSSTTNGWPRPCAPRPSAGGGGVDGVRGGGATAGCPGVGESEE